jgi:hypothetical protein
VADQGNSPVPGSGKTGGAITWLERRHNGDDPPTEVIVLALN